MEVFRASVALTICALVVSARWAGRSRQLSLEQMTAAAEANRVAALEAQVAVLEDRLEPCEAPVEIRPRLLTDNRDGYISGVLAEYLRARAIGHIRTAPPRMRSRSWCNSAPMN